MQAVTDNDYVGSSTAVAAKIDGCTLKTVNLGDSGYLVVRPDPNNPRSLETVYRSE